MSSVTSMILEVIGVDNGASKTFEKVSKSMEKTSDRSKKLKIAGGIALTALAAAAVDFGKKSIDKFQEVGGATLALQRVMGGTATQASRLNFAAEETGVSSDKLATSMKFLAKFMNNAQDSAYKQFTALDKANGKLVQQKTAIEKLDKPSQAQKVRLQEISKQLGINGKAQTTLGKSTEALGIKITDASGNMLPMNAVLTEAADLFSKMPAGAEKTALAVKIFGKSGQELLPFLNKGAEGLKELGVESDKYGNTLNDKDTKAVYANIIAKRQMGAAISGLEIQLGQHLMPAVTSVVVGFTSLVLWFSHLSSTTKTVIKVIASVVGVIALVIGITKAWIAVQTALDLVLTANPIGIIIVAIAAFVAAIILAYKHSAVFRAIVQGAFAGIAAGARGAWHVVGPILNAMISLMEKAGVIQNTAGSFKLTQRGADKRSITVKGGKTTANARGTQDFAGGLSWVGEEGPELAEFPPHTKIYPHNKSMQMAGDGGDMTHSAPIILKLDSRTVWQGLVVFKRQGGVSSLGLA